MSEGVAIGGGLWLFVVVCVCACGSGGGGEGDGKGRLKGDKRGGTKGENGKGK